jgi:CBS domain-containing protein
MLLDSSRSRDLLRILAKGLREDEPPATIMNYKVGDFMTPISQVIYARPDETVGMCRTIMAKLGIKCIPHTESRRSCRGDC